MAEKAFTFKNTLPDEMFECFKNAFIINTWNENPTDEEVEWYIYALLDTDDDKHMYDWKQTTFKPTFKPAD